MKNNNMEQRLKGHEFYFLLDKLRYSQDENVAEALRHALSVTKMVYAEELQASLVCEQRRLEKRLSTYDFDPIFQHHKMLIKQKKKVDRFKQIISTSLKTTRKKIFNH